MSSVSSENSIYPNFFLDNLVYRPTESKEKNQKNVLNFFLLSRFFATNAKLAMREFKKGHIKAFDPLVRDRCCQLHVMRILEIFQDPSVHVEISQLETTIEKILQLINKGACKVPVLKDERAFSRFIEDFKISIKISEKVQFLFNSYLLTMATTLHQPRHIDYQLLQIKLSKLIDVDTVKLIVSLARTAVSESSTQYVQETAAKLHTLSPEQKELLQSRLAIVRRFEINGNIGKRGDRSSDSFDYHMHAL